MDAMVLHGTLFINKKKRLFSLFLLVLTLFCTLQLVSAVSLNSGIVLNTSISNSSITFNGCSLDVEEIVINENYIELTNGVFSGNYRGDFDFYSHTESTNIDCSDLALIYATQDTPTYFWFRLLIASVIAVALVQFFIKTFY